MEERNENKKDEIKSDGTFKRQKSLFSKRFGTNEHELPVKRDHYRLIWSAACPWSHRATIVRKLLGLENVISLGEVDPLRPHVPRIDWAFSLDEDNVDPVLQVKYLSDVYKKTDPDYRGRPTVPAIVDIEAGKVVNNDYFTLTIDFATAWKKFHKENAPNLYPKHLQQEIDTLNDLIYADVNNGVYQCGFARSQHAYEKAFNRLFSRLDKLEKRLETSRFLTGDFITEADIRLYVTLARFDVAYYSHFKANKYRLVDYPNLWGYARDLYETEGFAETTHFDLIKNHYYVSARLSPVEKDETIIIPKGPDLSGWNEAPNRSYLSESDEKFYFLS